MQPRLSSFVRILPFLFPSLRVAAQDGNPEAIWAQIIPNSNLSWVSCYTDGLQCARFEVPLDYSKPAGPKAAVALLKVPSALNASDPAYKGPVFFHAGGPGGSSVDFLLDPNNRGLGQLVIGPEHDIIGIDPRGVGRTTPFLRIFETEAEASTFTVQLNDDPYFGTSPSAVGRTLARFQGLGDLAKARASDVAQYVSTPLVVRDLFAIMKAHGLDKLSYLGVSYSSVIGMTFATMFPQNVGNIAISGILDAEDYYSGSAQATKVTIDADNAMYVFYQACFKAGPQACAIYDISPDAIKARVDRILEGLKVQPLVASVGSSPGPFDYGVVDFGLVKNALFNYLYRPYDSAPMVASILAALEQGDANPMWQLLKATQEVTQCSAGHDAERAQLAVEPLFAIRCSDSPPVNDTLEQLQEWFEGNEKVSSFAGSSPIRVLCAGWKVRSVETFSGQVGANTSSPLLFLSNKYDPVTPLVNAQTMSKLFPGSALLVQDAIGHTTFYETSECTFQALQAFYRNGTLPDAGTVCSINEELFPTANATGNSQRRAESNAMVDAYRRVTKKSGMRFM